MWALRPAKPLGVLSRHPCRNPKPLPRGKGLYYWGYRPVQARTLAVSRTKSLHDAVTQMADDLYGGLRPKARMLWLLAKSFARCKPAEQATLDTPFLSSIEVFRQSGIRCFLNGGFFCLHRSGNALLAPPVITLSLLPAPPIPQAPQKLSSIHFAYF